MKALLAFLLKRNVQWIVTIKESLEGNYSKCHE